MPYYQNPYRLVVDELYLREDRFDGKTVAQVGVYRIQECLHNAKLLAARWNYCIGLGVEDIKALGNTAVDQIVAKEMANKELTAARALLREVLTDYADIMDDRHDEKLHRIRSYLDASDTLGGGA